MKRIAVLLVPLIGVSCTQGEKRAEDASAARVPASFQDEAPRLVYISYKDQKAVREEIGSDRWLGAQGGFSDGGREDYLLKMYYANSRESSLKGLRHAACFYGHADSVRNAFFREGDARGSIRNLAQPWPQTRASTDGRVLGVRFQHKAKGDLFFRLSHCDSGKSSISDVLPGAPFAIPNTKRKQGSATVPMRNIASVGEIGFQNIDKAPDSKTLPKFALRADYEKAAGQPDERPWAGLDLRDQKQAIRFALIMQKYFYENMANQDPKNPDMNFIAANNKKRYWCHMPWMNVGVAGREAIHGMTQERDMIPSKKIPVYQNAAPGTNWGVAYFNAPGCRSMHNVFGSGSSPKPEPDFNSGAFENGTVSTKILFTTAEFLEIKDSFTWYGNVSDVGSTERTVRTLRHIQMDISVKDSSLKGTDAAIQHWAMAGFYYDPDYDYDRDLKPVLGEENPLKSIPNLPKQLLKMRPMGVQTGFDAPETKESIIFPGAYANGSGGRLNGPADNPKTSCLGCHGAAGTGANMIPGFLSAKMFQPYSSNLSLDFNQQLALAKANYETQIPPAQK